MTRDDDQDDAAEGATELDVDLPGKIALSHEEVELEEQETLPVVQLPDGEQLEQKKVAPVLSPMPEADRSTEVVDLPRFEQVEARGAPLYLLLLVGLVIGIAVTLLILFLVW